MKKIFLIPIVIGGMLMSCKKSSSESSSCTLSSASIAGKYKLTDAKFTPAGSSTSQDVYSYLIDPCDQDNIIEFKADGTGTVTDTGTPIVCSPADDDSGTWSLNGTALVSSEDNFSGDVTNFSCSGFSISKTGSAGGFTGTVSFVLTKQQ